MNAPILIATSSLVVSFVNVLFYIESRIRNGHIQAANIEASLQMQMTAIRSEMDPRILSDEWLPTPNEKSEWVPIVKYWYFCFQEFTATEKSPNKIYQSVWRNSIRGRVRRGLNKRPLRFVLAHLIHNGAMKEGDGLEFIQEITSIWGKDVCSEFRELLIKLESNLARK